MPMDTFANKLVVFVFGTFSGYMLQFGVSYYHNLRFRNTEKLKLEEYLPDKPDKIPDHVAVIMDGNRRFGSKAYGDPLRV